MITGSSEDRGVENPESKGHLGMRVWVDQSWGMVRLGERARTHVFRVILVSEFKY